MREIKFRGKCITTGEWQYGSYHSSSTYGDLIYCTKVDVNDGMVKDYFIEVDPETVGQKLTWNNVYEGDIIDYFGRKFLIYYDILKNQFIAKNWKTNSFLQISYQIREFSQVIGNRWDNPELLEEIGAVEK